MMIVVTATRLQSEKLPWSGSSCCALEHPVNHTVTCFMHQSSWSDTAAGSRPICCRSCHGN